MRDVHHSLIATDDEIRKTIAGYVLHIQVNGIEWKTHIIESGDGQGSEAAPCGSRQE